MENSQLRESALSNLKGRWASAVILYVVYMVVLSICQLIPFVGPLLILFVSLPLGWGLEIAFLEFRRGHEFEVNRLFDGFRQFERVFCTKFLQVFYTALWSLLLYVPGIIKYYSYAMTSYVMLDDPTMQNNRAIEKSMQMMEGHKMKLFLLDLSLIGWLLLSILTCGIGLLWLMPYYFAAHAAFYEDLKKEMEVVPTPEQIVAQ